MIADINIPNNILLNIIIDKIKENTINLVHVHNDEMIVKLNKMNVQDWSYSEVYHICGDVDEMLNLMKVNPNVVYVEEPNINDGVRDIDIMGKLVVHNPK